LPLAVVLSFIGATSARPSVETVYKAYTIIQIIIILAVYSYPLY